ncbi:MAG: hypothetical protein DRI86_16345 [Bacteroidetes bacterium]|nr:MAG: hypothetical protein DRI86_16345 [Bacteroidota bacterium]
MIKQNTNINPNKWIADYGDMLYNYAYSRLSSSNVAEDIVQDTFVSALGAVKELLESS